MRADDGSIGAFVAVISLATIVVAGLVLDGGRLLAARRQAADIAANAARAGVQALDEHSLRSGHAVVDPVAAQAAVATHLAATPASGTAVIADNFVAVEVRVRVRMLLLGVVGVSDTTVSARREARPVQGVTSGAP